MDIEVINKKKYIILGENEFYKLISPYRRNEVLLLNKKTGELQNAINDRKNLNDIINTLNEEEINTFGNKYYGKDWKKWRSDGGWSSMDAVISWRTFKDRYFEVKTTII